MTTDPDIADSLVVLYASQTGNAEFIAKHIHEEALQHGFSSECHILDDYAKVDFAANNLLIVVASTTGDGDPPDNATKFWRWMRRGKKTEHEAFKGKKYALLGLGDTNYSNFCNTAKRLDRKFTELGATPVCPKGLADDATGLEAVVDPWIEKLWDLLPTLIKYDEKKYNEYKAKQGDEKTGALARLQNKDTTKTVNDAVVPNSSATADVKKDDLKEETTVATEKEPTNATQVSTTPQSEAVTSKSTETGKDNGDAGYVPIRVEVVRPIDIALTGLPKLPAQFVAVEDISGESRSTSPNTSNSIFNLLKKPTLNDTVTSTQQQANVTENEDVFSSCTVSSPCPVSVVSVKCLTGKKALKRVIEVGVDLSGLVPSWQYVPGDAFGILCPNADELVLLLLKRLKLEPGTLFKVSAIEGASANALSGLPFDTQVPCTYYEAFKFFLDLHALPRKSFFRMLAEYTTDPEEKQTLLFLCSTQGSTTYRNLRTQQATLLDFLHTFPSCQPPFARLLENLPRVQPRYYSIASSPLPPTQTTNGTTQSSAPSPIVKIAFNIVEYTLGARNVRGLCSGWLDDLTGKATTKGVTVDLPKGGSTLPSLVIPVFPKPPMDFRLPAEPGSAPIIMIAAGTGVTPFIGFLEHLERLYSSSSTPLANDVWLFYGARFNGEDGDVLYRDRLLSWRESKVLTRLEVALSRENGEQDVSAAATTNSATNGNVAAVKYVQDSIRKNGEDVMQIVHRGAYVYVCGSVDMARDVNLALAELAEKYPPAPVIEQAKAVEDQVVPDKATADTAANGSGTTSPPRRLKAKEQSPGAAFWAGLAAEKKELNPGQLDQNEPESPEIQEHYIPDAPFTCLDKSASIPFSAVNDDYCDCRDGSDEPGTSACSNGVFYCKNEGHIPVSIPSYKVNDGVCEPECCDGSDEHEGKVACPNRCKEVGAEYRQKMDEERKVKREGIRIRNEYIQHAASTRESRQSEILSLKQELANMTAKIEELTGILFVVVERGLVWYGMADVFPLCLGAYDAVIKSDAEEYEKRQNAIRAAAEQEDNRVQCPSKLVALETEVQQLKSKISTLKNQIHELEGIFSALEPLQYPEESAGGEATPEGSAENAVDSKSAPCKDDPAVRDALARYESYIEEWTGKEDDTTTSTSTYTYTPPTATATPDPNTIGVLDACEDPDLDFSVCASHTYNKTMTYIGNGFSGFFGWSGWSRLGEVLSLKGVLWGRLDWTEEARKLRKDPVKAREKFYEAERLKSDISRKIEDLEKKDKIDFGPAGVFEKLYGQCFSIDTVEYTYEVCMLEKALQKNKGQSWGTDLGKFTRWGSRSSKDERPTIGPVKTKKDLAKALEHYKVMMFENGARCWNGPERSVEVTLECGADTAVLSVSEPSKCEYNVRVRTPAVCVEDEDELVKVGNEVLRQGHDGESPATGDEQQQQKEAARDEL
ncbi:hypothetical protein HK102_007974 [Quaeritorhiza haematococci]|nr:hypothetical protein HK102_007974 [Quaeritorhiza haematococci]